ncbi:MAG: ABC transporter substrate-binding protein [Hyphomonadaceae bacterium]|nr:ABC transporter substrate-binding protein [Hyphomonadaceae bacterium]
MRIARLGAAGLRFGLRRARLSVAAVSCALLLGCGSPPLTNADGLLVLTDETPTGLDYDGPSAAIPQSQTGIVNLMEPLIDYAPGAVNDSGVRIPDFTRFEGRLAERWDFDAARGVLRLHLRRDAVSCAGNPLTAADVVYTFARAKSVSGAAPIGWFLANAGGVADFDGDVFTDPAARTLGDEVRAIDRHTVEIRQGQPNPLLLPVLTTFGLLIFDSVEMRARATEDDPWSHDYANNAAPPSFGPYCVERWVRSSELVLRANPHYYRGAAPIARIVIKRVPQSANRYMIMRMRQAHVAERLTPREVAAIEDVDGLAVRSVQGNESLFLHMNFATPPFDDPLVRRAIAAAIPTRQIIRNGYFGAAVPWTGVAPSSYPGAASGAVTTDDPARAAALLAQAGYPGGRGLERYPDAFRLAYVAEREAVLGPIAASLQTALRRLGVPATLDPIPSAQFGDRQLVKKDLPFALNDQEKPVVVDAGYAAQLFFVSASAGGVNNMVNYANPALDALWARARGETDRVRRTALIQDIQRLASADVAWAPIVEYRTHWVGDAQVQGWSWRPDNALRFYDLRFAP